MCRQAFRIDAFIGSALSPKGQEFVIVFHFGGIIVLRRIKWRKGRQPLTSLQFCRRVDAIPFQVNISGVLVFGLQLLNEGGC